MSVIEGHPAQIPKAGVLAEKNPFDLVGCYTSSRGTQLEFSLSTVPCPYCRQLLFGDNVPPGTQRIRLKYYVEETATHYRYIADIIPDTHLILSCGRCKQRFTLPKDPESCISSSDTTTHDAASVGPRPSRGSHA